jgi:hypothetical protein
MLEKHLQQVESQLMSEGQALQRGEDVSNITADHVDFFNSHALVDKIESCLQVSISTNGYPTTMQKIK